MMGSGSGCCGGSGAEVATTHIVCCHGLLLPVRHPEQKRRCRNIAADIMDMMMWTGSARHLQADGCYGHCPRHGWLGFGVGD